MNILFQILIFLIGLYITVRTMVSAISMFVLPRAAPNQVVRLVFGLVRRLFELRLKKTQSYLERDQIMAYYAPFSLMLLVPVWYGLSIIGFMGMYWAIDNQDWNYAFRLSGSSILTLGFEASTNFWLNLLMFSEALIGLTLVALLIAYLPSMYTAFSRREALVNLLTVRAGSPPFVEDMLVRFHLIHGLHRLTDIWSNWEKWFVELEESHTTLPPVVFFRSPRPENSWITATGAVLDAASFTLAAVDVPNSPEAALCIRSGYLALRRIADIFEIKYPLDPHFPQDSSSITEQEFNDLFDRLKEQGIPMKKNRQQAWVDYAGWRVNYDVPLLALCSLTMAPYAPWSSDRAPKMAFPSLFLRKNKKN